MVVHRRLTVLGHLRHLQLTDRCGAPDCLATVETRLVPQVEEGIQASAVQQDVAATLLQIDEEQSNNHRETMSRRKKEMITITLKMQTQRLAHEALADHVICLRSE